MMPTATIAEASKLFMLLSVELTIWLRCHQKPLLIVKRGFGSRSRVHAVAHGNRIVATLCCACC